MQVKRGPALGGGAAQWQQQQLQLQLQRSRAGQFRQVGDRSRGGAGMRACPALGAHTVPVRPDWNRAGMLGCTHPQRHAVLHQVQGEELSGQLGLQVARVCRQRRQQGQQGQQGQQQGRGQLAAGSPLRRWLRAEAGCAAARSACRLLQKWLPASFPAAQAVMQGCNVGRGAAGAGAGGGSSRRAGSSPTGLLGGGRPALEEAFFCSAVRASWLQAGQRMATCSA